MRRQRQVREGQEKRENRRPILKKLCAALLHSFRRQHGEKTKGSTRGNWDSQGGQQPFRLNSNGAGDRTTTLRRLLIGAADGPGPGELPGFWAPWSSAMPPSLGRGRVITTIRSLDLAT